MEEGYRGRILSGTAVKIIGIVLMTMDHLHQMFAAQGAPDWLRWFGRPVAAMFIFLCAEGFHYTRSRKRYLLRLLAGFLFMSLMNHLFSSFMLMEEIVLINNIFGALFMAAFYMWMIELFLKRLRKKSRRGILLALGGMILPLIAGLALFLALGAKDRTAALILLFIPSPVSAEGGFMLISMGVLFYFLRNHRLIQAGIPPVVGALSWYTSGNFTGFLIAAAALPLLLYNGKRGRGNTYFFYIFYPAHIYLFYVIAWFLRGRG